MNTIPAAYRDVQWDALLPGTLRDTVLQYLQEFPTALQTGKAPLFLGQALQGKTTAAVLIAIAVMEQAQQDIEFVSIPEVRPTLEFDSFSSRVSNYVLRWMTVPFLVMDDFAVAQSGSKTAIALEAVITKRFNNLLPTLWTGNILLPDRDPFAPIAERYGALFARRLEQRAQGYTVLLG